MKGSSGADTILEPVRERGSTGKTWVGETRASVMIADRTTLSIAKAGELVGVTRRTIYNWIAGGKVEYVRTAGGSVRIFVDTLWRDPHAGVTRPGYARNLGRRLNTLRGLNVALPRLPAPLRRASPVPWSGAPPHAATGASAPSPSVVAATSAPAASSASISPPPANDPSVGMEQLYGRPEEFARRDPEYFDWLWKWVVRGETD